MRCDRMILRQAPFALRVVARKDGKAAVIYRRHANEQGRDRLQRVAGISPLAYTAARSLLRDAIRRSEIALGNEESVRPGDSVDAQTSLLRGPFYPLDEHWGTRVACYALIAAGLTNGERLGRAATHLRDADPTEAAWWLGMLSREDNVRPLRALRILMEAVA